MEDAKRRSTRQIINLVVTNSKEHSRRLEICNRILKSSCVVKILWGTYIKNKWTTWFLQVASFLRMVYFVVWRNSSKKIIPNKSTSRLKVQINWSNRMPQDLNPNSIISTSANLYHHRLMSRSSTYNIKTIRTLIKMPRIYKTLRMPIFCHGNLQAVPPKIMCMYITQTKGFLKTVSCSNPRARTTLS